MNSINSKVIKNIFFGVYERYNWIIWLIKSNEKTMTVIWYNPDIDRYEKGFRQDYVVTTTLSKNFYRFEILHVFESTTSSNKIADKILMNLNLIRSNYSTE